MLIAGVDPGLGGAIAILGEGGVFVGVWDTPVAQVGTKHDYLPSMMASLLAHYTPPMGLLGRVVIEKVGAFPGQGVTSCFNFGRGLGLWEGICAAEGLAVWRVAPQRWQKAFGLRGGEKDASRLEAQRRWPTAELGRKKDHGRAESLLLAQFGLDHWK